MCNPRMHALVAAGGTAVGFEAYLGTAPRVTMFLLNLCVLQVPCVQPVS